ncbi:MAG: SEC-C metal-binding domain-containing protein [Solirubrobacteraceae bacterium]
MGSPCSIHHTSTVVARCGTSFRRVVHRPGGRPPSVPKYSQHNALVCWCGSNKSYRECHGAADFGMAA